MVLYILQDRVSICVFELYRGKNTAEVHNVAEKLTENTAVLGPGHVTYRHQEVTG